MHQSANMNHPPAAGPFGNGYTNPAKIVVNAATATTVLEMAPIPANSVIGNLRAAFEALGTGVTIDIGYKTASTTDATYFGAAVAAAAAGDHTFSGLPLETTEQATLIVTIGGATTTAADKLIWVVPEYLYKGA